VKLHVESNRTRVGKRTGGACSARLLWRRHPSSAIAVQALSAVRSSHAARLGAATEPVVSTVKITSTAIQQAAWERTRVLHPERNTTASSYLDLSRAGHCVVTRYAFKAPMLPPRAKGRLPHLSCLRTRLASSGDNVVPPRYLRGRKVGRVEGVHRLRRRPRRFHAHRLPATG